MLESFPVALCIATALGILAGLGVGGGSLLMLWLTLVIQMPQSQARIYNLLFFLPTAIIASIFRFKQGKLSIKNLLPAMVAGSISALVFSMIGQKTDTSLLRTLFGILLLIIGVKELRYKPKNTED